jgi:hypothetical protein
MYFFEKAQLGKIYVASIDAIFVVSNTYFLIFQYDLFLWKRHYSIPDKIISTRSLLTG